MAPTQPGARESGQIAGERGREERRTRGVVRGVSAAKGEPASDVALGGLRSIRGYCLGVLWSPSLPALGLAGGGFVVVPVPWYTDGGVLEPWPTPGLPSNLSIVG